MATSILFLSKKCFKKRSKKSFLNFHFWGFGAKTRSDSCRSCFSDHFGRVDVPFRPMDDHFVTIWVFFAVSSAKKVGILDLFWLAACRRRFFFGPNSVSLGKGPFSSAGGLPQALFFGKKWRFRWKNDVFAFYKGCQQSYREPFINFLALLGHSQRKSWFYHFFQKI